MTSQKLGANDCVDEDNVPVGQWASRSWGGWTLVGKASASESASKVPSQLTAQGSSPSHAVLAGVSGEPHARLAIETGEHPAILRDQVTTPGGTTITAVAELEKQGLRSMFIDTVAMATERSRQLGEG